MGDPFIEFAVNYDFIQVILNRSVNSLVIAAGFFECQVMNALETGSVVETRMLSW